MRHSKRLTLTNNQLEQLIVAKVMWMGSLSLCLSQNILLYCTHLFSDCSWLWVTETTDKETSVFVLNCILGFCSELNCLFSELEGNSCKLLRKICLFYVHIKNIPLALFWKHKLLRVRVSFTYVWLASWFHTDLIKYLILRQDIVNVQVIMWFHLMILHVCLSEGWLISFRRVRSIWF